jgi:hypothetical protein
MLFVAPVLIGVLYAFLMSLLREPTRRRLNAIMVAGAGAAYLSSGSFGAWEFVFTAAVTYCAYRGLDSYVWIGIAWLLHTAGTLCTTCGEPRSSPSPRTRRSAARSATR